MPPGLLAGHASTRDELAFRDNLNSNAQRHEILDMKSFAIRSQPISPETLAANTSTVSSRRTTARRNLNRSASSGFAPAPVVEAQEYPSERAFSAIDSVYSP